MSLLKDIPYQQYKRACQLATASGFFKAYFDALPNNRTNEETYLAVNEEYLEHFGEENYSCYNSFRNSLSKYRKKKLTQKS
ncbi:hypothetical protein [Nonlabens sp.]|jgi:hypothetical protein|uniref:hypothetical protein n=1 Tax=Nonlabens sp. TaxID=1888209 RepID=UPI0039E4B77B